jgi:hypothetical protein
MILTTSLTIGYIFSTIPDFINSMIYYKIA